VIEPLRGQVCVTVLDPFTFNSSWVLRENELAANAGIPIVLVYDADRYRWDGQLDKWRRLHPWVFGRQVVALTKSQRRASVEMVLKALRAAAAEGRSPPDFPVDVDASARVKATVGVGGSRETETRHAVETAHRTLLTRLDGQQPSLIVAAFTCTHDAAVVAKRIDEYVAPLDTVPWQPPTATHLTCVRCVCVCVCGVWYVRCRLSPTVPMIGCTSCRGVVLNDTWLTHQKQFALGLWGICDDAGAYSTVHILERPTECHAHHDGETSHGESHGECTLRDVVFAEVCSAWMLQLQLRRQLQPPIGGCNCTHTQLHPPHRRSPLMPNLPLMPDLPPGWLLLVRRSLPC
jgi:hypothetical protein